MCGLDDGQAAILILCLELAVKTVSISNSKYTIIHVILFYLYFSASV